MSGKSPEASGTASEAAAEVRSRIRTLLFLLLLAGVAVGLLVEDSMTPINYGPGFNLRSYDVDESHELIPGILFPSIILPFALLFITKREWLLRCIGAWCFGSAIYVGIVFIFLKLTVNPVSVSEKTTPGANTLIGTTEAIELMNIFIALPLAIVCGILALGIGIGGYLGGVMLAGKGYEFSMQERARLFLTLGFELKKLPRREEFAVLPGYGGGSVKEIVALMEAIEEMRPQYGMD